jgi:cytochrome P450
MTLPPGPELPAAVQAVAYHRDPLGVLRRARDRFGPVFTLRVPKPIVFVAEPDAVELVANAGRAGQARRTVLPLASPRSLFGADGEEHRALRAALEPRFRDLDTEAIAAIAREHVATWPRGAAFRLLPRMRDLSTEVFGRVILGLPSSAAYVAAVRRMLRTPGNPPLPVPGDAFTARVFRQRAAPLIRLLEDAGLDSDRWLVVIAAGQEPPAIALANVAYELARRPELEPDAAFVAEILRLRPSASAVLRELTEPLRVDGHELPSGATVALPSPLLQRDPSAFPDPDAFRPGRPTAGVPYFPFGGGPRRCIGEPLAHALLETVPPLLPRLRPVWPRPERMVVRGTVLVPHRGAVVAIPARGVPRPATSR